MLYAFKKTLLALVSVYLITFHLGMLLADTNSTWTGATNNDLGINTNWSGSALPDGTASFDIAGAGSLTSVNTSFNPKSILFTGSAPAYNLDFSVTAALSLSENGVVNFSPNTQTFDFETGTSLTFGDSLSTSTGDLNVVYNFFNDSTLTFLGSTNPVGEGVVILDSNATGDVTLSGLLSHVYIGQLETNASSASIDLGTNTLHLTGNLASDLNANLTVVGGG